MYSKPDQRLFHLLNLALRKVTIQEGKFNFHDSLDELLRFSNEFSKNKPNIISWMDIAFHFISEVQNFAPPKNFSGTFSELVPPKDLQIFQKKVFGFFNSLPFTYEFLIPFPWFSEFKSDEFNLYDDFSITRAPKNLKKAGKYNSLLDSLNIKSEPKTPLFFLRVFSKGFSDFGMDSSACSNALSKFKPIFQYCIAQGLLVSLKVGEKGLGFDEYCNIHFRIANEDNNFSVIELPDQFRQFVLGFRPEIKHSKFQSEYYRMVLGGKNGDPEIFAEISKPIFKLLLLKESFRPPLSSILNALEWQFNSNLFSDHNISFINVCIALEAVLGDDKIPEKITEQLADRCALIIADSILERAKIKERFKKLYSVRSQIIHGRKRELAPEERKYLDMGRYFLNKIILKEMTKI